MGEQKKLSAGKPNAQSRGGRLLEHAVEAIEDLFSKEAVARDRQFEDDVERQLKNGAKFVPRKRKPR